MIAEGLSRVTDPISSKEAGDEAVAVGVAKQHRNRILAVMGTEPLTNCQHAKLSGLGQYQTTRRMTELARLGLVERGPFVTCPILGRKAGTWKIYHPTVSEQREFFAKEFEHLDGRMPF